MGNIKKLENEVASLEIVQTGAVISSFCLHHNSVNPLSFVMETEPGSDTFYRGHFVCIGRWGDPSEGERNKGVLKHGDFHQLNFSATRTGDRQLVLQARSGTEGLAVEKTVTLDSQNACFKVTEVVANTMTVSRLCNVVQHPTLAAPFLDIDTIVNCNAATGFAYTKKIQNDPALQRWPNAPVEERILPIDTAVPGTTGVYSYVVNPADKWGWITAYAPAHHTLLGYLWKRETYPWINHWLHWQNNTLQYRGLEFGTTGLHHSYPDIVAADALHRLNENTCFMLDAGEKKTFSYIGFIMEVKEGFGGMESVTLEESGITYRSKGDPAGHVLKIENALQL